MLAQFSRGQQRTCCREQRVVVALGRRAGVAVDRFLRRGAIHTRSVVQRVAHAGGGQLGQNRLHGGAQLGGEHAAQFRHAVEALLAQGEAAAAGAVVIGVGAIRIETIGEVIGQFGELFRAKVRARSGQVGLDSRAGRSVHPAGQAVEEPADHRHLPGAECALALGGGGRGQERIQEFAGQPVPWPQIISLFDAPGGFGAADQRRLGDRLRQRAAQLLGGRLVGQVVDQRILHCRDPPAEALAALQQLQALLGVRRVKRQRAGPVQVGIKRVEHREGVGVTTWTHTAKLATPTDRKASKIAIDAHSRKRFHTASGTRDRGRARGRRSHQKRPQNSRSETCRSRSRVLSVRGLKLAMPW